MDIIIYYIIALFITIIIISVILGLLSTITNTVIMVDFTSGIDTTYLGLEKEGSAEGEAGQAEQPWEPTNA